VTNGYEVLPDVAALLAGEDTPFLAFDGQPSLGIAPHRLFQMLAASDDPRERMAIIALLLRHPEYSSDARHTCARLMGRPRTTLMCFYEAARLLQLLHGLQLEVLLGGCAVIPGAFCAELGVDESWPFERQLRTLAGAQARLSGDPLNWLGTYGHVASRLMAHLERRQTWNR